MIKCSVRWDYAFGIVSCVLSVVFVYFHDRSDVHCGSEVDESNRHFIIQQETAAS